MTNGTISGAKASLGLNALRVVRVIMGTERKDTTRGGRVVVSLRSEWLSGSRKYSKNMCTPTSQGRALGP